MEREETTDSDPGEPGQLWDPDALQKVVRQRCLAALVLAYEPLPTAEAHRALAQMVARFEGGLTDQFADAMGRGFYAAMCDDMDLEELFVVMVGASRVPKEWIPPMPKDFWR